jgi:LysR family transcriptional regulator for metE and metH
VKRIPPAVAPSTPLLDTRDLRLVVALHRAGTTARAAEALHLSQPAVSRALLSIEERLGTPLFSRTPRGLVVTDAGERLLAGAPAILDALRTLEASVCEPPPARLRIRLVCECYTAYHWVPSALKVLRDELPGIEVSLRLEHTARAAEAIESGEIDVALLTACKIRRGVVDECPLFEDEIVFVVSSSHPLAARPTLAARDLEAWPLVSSAPLSEALWFASTVFGRRRPRVRHERLPLTEAVMDMARAGMGIAVVSEWVASPHLGRGDLVAKRLASGPLRRRWRLAWRRDADVPARRLAALLRSAAPRRP